MIKIFTRDQDWTPAPPSTRRVVVMLALSAVLLAVLSVGAATVIVALSGGDGAGVRERMADWIPWILAINHTLVFLVLLRVLRGEGRGLRSLGWRRTGARFGTFRELLLGVALGMGMVLIQLYVFLPLRPLVQLSVGEVGPGGVDVSGVPLVWLGVSVVLPLVEECVYRGYGLNALRDRYSTILAVVVTSVFFGLLHWGQGTWGVFDTTLLGFLLAGIFVWRGNLWCVTAAHSTFNAIVILRATLF